MQQELGEVLKITGIKTVVVNAVHRNWIFVKVKTDQPGLYGWGEATLEWKTRAVTGAIDDLAPFVVGQDPMNIEHLVNAMTRFSFWPLGSACSGSYRSRPIRLRRRRPR